MRTNKNIKTIELDKDYFLFDGDTLKIYKIPKEKKYEIDKYNREEDKVKVSDVNLSRLKRLTLCVTKLCNLNCKYCYEGEKKCAGINNFMNEETLHRAIDYIINEYPKGINCIQFFGGEPLLNKDIIKKTIEYCTKVCEEKKLKSPAYTIVTNGTLIDEEVHNLFNKYFKRITISLDGKKKVNDINRIFLNSNESVYDSVVQKLKKYSDRNYKVDIQMTITEEQFENNSVSIDDYIHLKELGAESIQISPLIITKGYHIDDIDEYNKKIIDFFNQCYDYELRNIDKTNFYKLISLVDNLKNKRICDHYCGAGFWDISVDASGDIYPCFMFNENARFIMGNVFEDSDIFKEARKKYIDNRISRNDKCANCWAHGICNSGHSGCIGAFYLENGRIDKPIDRNCLLSKSMFEKALYNIGKIY